MKKWGKRILILLVFLVTAGAGLLYHLIHRSDSMIDGTVVVEGISQPVRIVRDIHGVPHIFAQNQRDLAFAFGYAQAQDRLWQLDLLRRLGQGRLAETFGPVAEVLETDKFFRTVFFVPDREALTQRSLDALSSESREELDAFLLGINSFVTLHPGQLPIEYWLLGLEFEPLKIEDLGAIPLTWWLSVNYDDEVLSTKIAAKLGPEVLAELFPVAPVTILPGEVGALSQLRSVAGGQQLLHQGVSPFAELSRTSLARLSSHLETSSQTVFAMPRTIPAASNSWVVGGKRSTSGKPILASDPHLGIGMPSTWYEAHLVAPGLDVIGVALPGLPYISIGHNRRIAWGITNVMADNQDLFIERLNPDNPNQVWFIDHWENVTIAAVSIPVKGQEPIKHEVRATRHGPLISSMAPGLTETLAVQWVMARRTPQEFAGNAESFRLLGRASNWEEFRAAVAPMLGASNMMYADVDGNIGWQVAGAIPRRAKGDGRFPVPGWTGEYEWDGLVPFEELPHYYLPALSDQPQVTGSPVTSTPTHALATANQRTTHAEYPHSLSQTWIPAYRFLRISELLGQKEKMSVEDMQRYQADVYTLFADTLIPLLDEVRVDSEDLALALQVLREWDRQVTQNAPGAILYELTHFHLLKNTYSDELGDLYGDYAGRSAYLYTGLDAIIDDPEAKWWDDVQTPETETRSDILRRSLLDAVLDVKQRLGSDPSAWRWRDIHPAVFKHALGQFWPLDWFFNRSVPVGGDNQTVNLGGFAGNSPFNVNAAPSFRMVVDLADVAHAFSMHTTGQSGRPSTPHYDDMIQPWADVEYHPMWMDEEDILAHAEGILILMPQGTASGE